MRGFWLIFSVLFLLSSLVAQVDSLGGHGETYNPLELNEPPMSIYNGALIYEVFTGLGEGTKSLDTSKVIVVDGYKVQLFSTEDFYLADSLYKMCMEIFGKGDVERVFNSPYYKIRVGNCLTREEAEKLLQTAVKAGFKDSWIIRTKVRVKERVRTY